MYSAKIAKEDQIDVVALPKRLTERDGWPIHLRECEVRSLDLLRQHPRPFTIPPEILLSSGGEEVLDFVEPAIHHFQVFWDLELKLDRRGYGPSCRCLAMSLREVPRWCSADGEATSLGQLGNHLPVFVLGEGPEGLGADIS